MNIIFLDVDGVLNDSFSQRFDEKRINIINHIIEKSNFKIVVSSTLRNNPLLFNKLKTLVNNIIDKTKNLSKYVNHFETLRVAEILEYISSHNVNKFLVIDDAYLLMENFYFIADDNGLQKKDINNILKILN